LKVTVLEIDGSHVKLGFEADADVPVHRSEVWEQINANGRAGRLAKRTHRGLKEVWHS
jgi:carbon storage regulator CsrA